MLERIKNFFYKMFRKQQLLEEPKITKEYPINSEFENTINLLRFDDNSEYESILNEISKNQNYAISLSRDKKIEIYKYLRKKNKFLNKKIKMLKTEYDYISAQIEFEIK